MSAIVDQLIAMTLPNIAFTPRSGGLIGLAGVAIALNEEIPSFLKKMIPTVLSCLQDPDGRLRYQACESMYNM